MKSYFEKMQRIANFLKLDRRVFRGQGIPGTPYLIIKFYPILLSVLDRIFTTPSMLGRCQRDLTSVGCVNGICGIGSQVVATIIAGPAGGVGMMAAQIMGSTYEGLVKEGVEPKRALNAGFAAGAEIILMPEVKWKKTEVLAKVKIDKYLTN